MGSMNKGNESWYVDMVINEFDEQSDNLARTMKKLDTLCPCKDM